MLRTIRIALFTLACCGILASAQTASVTVTPSQGPRYHTAKAYTCDLGGWSFSPSTPAECAQMQEDDRRTRILRKWLVRLVETCVVDNSTLRDFLNIGPDVYVGNDTYREEEIRSRFEWALRIQGELRNMKAPACVSPALAVYSTVLIP